MGTNLINELIKVSDGALGCGQFVSSGFTFNIDFGAAAPTSTPYLLYSTNAGASNSWTTIGTVSQLAGFQSYTDSTSDTQALAGFYLVSCGTNCWRPTGYITTTVPGNGWALVANQLDAPANTLNQLFNPMPNGAYLPNGTQILIQNTSGSWTFTTYTWTVTPEGGTWGTGGNSVTLSPGQGFWVTNASANQITLAFAGLVRQGTLTNQIPPINERIYSSMVPQAGGLTSSLGYVPTLDDEVYIWNVANQTYYSYAYTAPGGGQPAWHVTSGPPSPTEPTLALGQSFALIPAAANTWSRPFSTCGLQ
ncbi:MAG: hypothetical protein ACLQM8_01580 [Limisphaerales bacterium]